jgi:heme/copper-type cytochrome/quinol oxidase subunit 2
MAHTLEVKDSSTPQNYPYITENEMDKILTNGGNEGWQHSWSTTSGLLIALAIIISVVIYVGIVYFSLTYATKERDENRKLNRKPDYNIWYAWIVIILAFILLRMR